MAKVSLSGSEKSIEDIWSWYDDQKEALRDFRNKIINILLTTPNSVHDKFTTLTLEELNEYFDYSEQELEHLVSFDLISATEGTLRADFFSKVFDKDKSDLGREFRAIYKAKGNKVSLEEDIIESWKSNNPETKSDFGNLQGLLHYRHWLAHGRYWDIYKKGRIYKADETYGIAESIFNFVP
jgi:hypothetical protein